MKLSTLNPFLATLLLVSAAQAAPQTWIDANTNNNWNTTDLNWDPGGAWTQNNNAIFGGTGETVTLTEGISAGGLTFNSSGYTITGNTLTLAADSVINTGANNATVNSALAGTSFVKSGSGTLALGNINSYAGTITISQGRLQLNTNTTLGAAANLVIGDANSGSTNPNVFFNNATPTISSLTVAAGVTGAGVYSNSWAQNISGLTTLNSAASLNLTISTNNADNEGDRVFTGVLTGMTSNLILNGSGTQEFSGANLNYTNGTNLDNGTLKLTKTSNWNSNIAFGATNSPTLQLNSPLAADSWNFTKQITGGSANAEIEKTGSGVVILTPAAGSTFVGTDTGALTVTGGKLYLNGAFTTGPAVSVANGATFGGTSTAGTIAVASGGTLEGGMGGTGTLTAGDVTLATATTLKGGLSATAGNKALDVTNLTIDGGNQSVTLDASGMGLTSGNYYDLLVSANAISAPNADSVLAALKSNARAYTPNVSGGNTIQLYYDANASVYWTGNNGTAWNTSATNFKLTGNHADTQFMANDVVYFNDGPTSSTVDISSGDVSPVSTSFTNSTATSYTLQGSNGIATGLITKTGDGTVTITNINTTNGAVALNGGTVSISQSGGLGTGSITFDGGELEYTGGNTTWSRSLAVNSGGGTVDVATAGTTLTHTGPLTGSGVLTKDGAGAFALSQTSGTISTPLHIVDGWLNLNYGGGNVTYSGDITGSTGGLSLVGTGSSATAGLTLAGNMTFSGDVHVYGRRIFLDSPTSNGALSGANIVFKQGHWPWHDLTLTRDISYTGATTVSGGRLVLQDTTSLGSSGITMNGGTLELKRTTGFWSYNNAIIDGTGAGDLVKSGAGTVTLGGVNTYDGTTDVQEGTLALGATGSIAYSPTINVASGATLDVTAQSAWSLATGQTLTGNGTVKGNLTVGANSTLAPGNSIGTLAIDGNLTLAGISDFEVDPTNLADLARVTGLLTFGGTLNVTQFGTNPFGAGDTFNLFDWGTVSGTFDTVNLPALTGGLTWDQSKLYTDGSLAVIPEPSALLLLGLGALCSGLRRRR